MQARGESRQKAGARIGVGKTIKGVGATAPRSRKVTGLVHGLYTEGGEAGDQRDMERGEGRQEQLKHPLPM